jgi:hypothetical protein
LFGWLIVHGPGALSRDRLIAPQLAGSAIPFGRALRVLGEWLSGTLLPVYQLLVRGGIAWLLGVSVLAAAPAGILLPAVAACLLLAIGLMTRGAALWLAVMTAGAALSDPMLGVPVPRLFLLTLFVLHGGGALSIDARIAVFLRRRDPCPGNDLAIWNNALRVVIVGAGFGGIAVATARKPFVPKLTG